MGQVAERLPIEIVLTKGLPGSGKTTWALKEVAEGRGRVKRINKDDLRAMIDGGAYSAARETTILAARNALIRVYLDAADDGASIERIIVDDTNLNPLHETNLRERFEPLETVSVQDFTAVSLADCIKHDLARANSVGHKVIRRMHDRYLRQQPDQVRFDPDLPSAIICDLDGTLALHTERSPYEYQKVGTDSLNQPVAAVVERLRYDEEGSSYDLIIMTARPESCRKDTWYWLAAHGLRPLQLLMRQTSDNREDSIVKEELFNQFIRGQFNVLAVLDDRDRVVSMWRRLGLLCLQVAEGDF